MSKIIILLLSIIVFSYAKTITITADEWCPYNCEAKSENKGYMIEIAKNIFEKEGYELVYIVSKSWEDAIKQTRDGKFNAVVGALKSEVPDFIFPRQTQGTSSDSFFVKKNSTWHYDGVESLNQVTLGCIKDYGYGKDIDAYVLKNINDIKKVQCISGNRALYQNAKKLLYNTIDMMIEDPNVLEYNFRLKGTNIPFKMVGYTNAEDIYIAFSPHNHNSKKYAEILSKGMLELRKSGELKKILDEYGLKDWQ